MGQWAVFSLLCFLISVGTDGTALFKRSNKPKGLWRGTIVRPLHTNRTTSRADDFAVVEQRVSNQQMFSLKADCNKACVEHISSQLEQVLACRNVKFLPGLRIIEGEFLQILFAGCDTFRQRRN